MDIIILDKCKNTITLAIGLSKNKEKFYNKINELNKCKNSNLELYKSIKNKIESTLNIETTNLDKLFHYGHINDFTNLKVLLPYRIHKNTKEPYFRDYTKSLEQQKESDWLINICPDARTSFNTLKTVIKNKYGIIATFILKDE